MSRSEKVGCWGFLVTALIVVVVVAVKSTDTDGAVEGGSYVDAVADAGAFHVETVAVVAFHTGLHQLHLHQFQVAFVWLERKFALLACQVSYLTLPVRHRPPLNGLFPDVEFLSCRPRDVTSLLHA